MARPLILLVDDDSGILGSLTRALDLEAMEVRTATSGRVALEIAHREPPSIVVLDLGLPDRDGLEVCRTLVSTMPDVPICILSARDEVADRVAGLEAGADDYLVKPFAIEELLARIRALLRRRPPSGGRIVAGGVVVHPERRTASIDGRSLTLTRREFDLLEVLARNHDVVLSRSQLLDLVWGYDVEVDSNVVDVFVGYLRRKLEADGRPRIIHTERGVGFVLRSTGS